MAIIMLVFVAAFCLIAIAIGAMIYVKRSKVNRGVSFSYSKYAEDA